MLSKGERGLTATAYHEAGHVVVGWWEGVGRRLLEASIVADPTAGTLGHVKRVGWPRVRDIELGSDGRPKRSYRGLRPDFDDPDLVERHLRPEVVELYAGVLGERQWSGRRYNWTGAVSDLRTADDYITYTVGSPEQARLFGKFLWQVALDAVTAHWDDVERLAQELLVRRTMSGRAVEELLKPASRPLGFDIVHAASETASESR